MNLKIIQDINKMSGNRLNERFIELMDKLSDIMLKQGEPFRARAYQKAQETIMSYPDDITEPEQLKGKANIGTTIMEKLQEYSTTGTLKVLEREKNNPVNILSEVYGIGPKKANELVGNGITSIHQLRENQHLLNDVQKVGLKYYEDVLERIPRLEIERYESIFKTNFSKFATEKTRFEIVGSYRRGAQNSGDIDVIITAETPSVFINFIDALIQQQIIAEVLSRGPTKCLVIAKIPSSSVYRRVDFLYTSPEEYPFSVLYFTGSKIFNTVMRQQALSMGLTMNEHGLYVMRDKKKAERVNNVFTCEKDIFDYLHMEYKTPIERIDGRAVTIFISNPVENKKPLLIIEDENEDDNFEIISKQPKKKTLKKKETIVKLEKPSPPKTKPKLIIEDDYNVKQIITDFRQNGILVLQKLNETQLTNILIEANNAYFNSESIMTDNEYDILKDLIEKKYPNNKSVTEIGAPIEKNKVTLPYQMASMDKIKPDTDVLKTWNKKYSGPYVLSCKLDGVSGLYTTEGSVAKLYTRGDGKVGQDVSHLISYLRLPKKKDLVIRGEFIIPKLVFDTKYKEKFANPRNMVAGIINQKATNETVNDLRFVVYEVIQPVMKPTEQMNFLKTLDVEYVLNTTENVLSNELLSHYLVDWRNNSSYELDGVIVTNDAIYERKTGNPEHSFAFKMVLSEQIAEAKVVDVIWTPSKDGYLKPRVQIEPIHLCGVKIEYATGFNGAFIKDNKVGIGAIIELIRSGDVIPHIRKVVVPAETAKMPSVSYEWNDTHIDVKLEDIESDETVKEKNITGFFKGIGVEGLSSGNVSRIIHAGYNSVSQIIKMTIDDLLEVEGFQIKTATKIHDGIKEKIEAVSLVTIMSSSNLFGRGFSEKKLELIMDSYPKVLLSTETVKQKIAKVAAIKGMAEKTSEAFVERIPYFIQFMKECNLVNKLALTPSIPKHVDTEHCLYGKSIVMTGFRDNMLQTGILNVGGKIGSSVSKNTFMVLVKDLDEDTGKAEEARKLGIPIMTPSLFKSKYL